MFNLPEARSMTRKERKKFRLLGLDPAFQNGELSVAELNEKIIDFVCDEIYKIDDAPYNEIAKLADATYRRTYSMPDDLKNSQASGAGTVTDAQSIVEPVEKQD